jgi:hypothetical protein
MLLTVNARADLTLSVIEYRVLADLGQVRLTTTSIHDEAIQDRMVKDRERFERGGVVLVNAKKTRSFVRQTKIGAHVVETKIVLEPPLGHGFRGGLPTADIVVTIDGKTRIDCSFDSGDIELYDVGILVNDNLIHIRGSRDDKLFDERTPLMGGKIIDDYWLRALSK